MFYFFTEICKGVKLLILVKFMSGLLFNLSGKLETI